MKPVVFPVLSHYSSARKRKARPPSPSSDEDDVEIVGGVPTPRRSSPRPLHKSARLTQRRDDSDNDLDNAGGDSLQRAESYKLKIPAVLPERAPSVPLMNTVPDARGHRKFTDEDIAYFVNLILWQAKTVPDVSKRTIQATLKAQVCGPRFSAERTEFTSLAGYSSLCEIMGLVLVACTRPRDSA